MAISDLTPLMDLACEAARAGGAIAQSVSAQAYSAQSVKQKQGKGLVTELDEQAEQRIVEILRSNSEFPILGEEGGLQGSPGEIETELRWVVDPIDGTTNLARGLPLFTTSVALLAGSHPLVGAVYDPMRDECFYAANEQGAFLNGTPIEVSQTVEAAKTVLFVNHGYPEEDRVRAAEVFDRLLNKFYLRKLGSSALELAYVAAGRADAFICSGDELWDYAAGLVLVEEAGGNVSDWRGKDWDGSSSFVLAANGMIAERLVDTLCDLQPSVGIVSNVAGLA